MLLGLLVIGAITGKFAYDSIYSLRYITYKVFIFCD